MSLVLGGALWLQGILVGAFAQLWADAHVHLLIASLHVYLRHLCLIHVEVVVCIAVSPYGSHQNIISFVA